MIHVTMNLFAMGVGYLIISAVLMLFTMVAGLLLWHFFPAKPAFMRGQKLIGRLVIDDRMNGQNLNLLVGLQSRRKPRWFFGLMLLDNTNQPPRWPRIISKKF